jgi:hypothetical protein
MRSPRGFPGVCSEHDPDDIAYPDNRPCYYHCPYDIGTFYDPDNESCYKCNDNLSINNSYDDTGDLADHICHNNCHNRGCTNAGEPYGSVLCRYY